MGLVLTAGFAAGIRAAAATENTDPDILALMAQLPNDQAAGACDVPKATASPSALASAQASGKPSSAADCAHGDQGGPFASDFINIANVTTKARETTPGRGASKGTFVSACGRNANNHHNPDNFIVAPGVSNGAHHVHDYVGNLSTDGFSTDQSLAAAGTTCNGNDKSAYFWPVLRTRGKSGPDADQPGGGPDANVGTILRPAQVSLQFRGNATSRVRAMPRFLRVITGDAKAGTNGPTNARAAWTCTGFDDRTTTKYPICPQGSKVERILDFPSCWDGKNTDSANHRSHIVFPKNDGSCWQKTVAVPQLRMVLAYDVPAKSLFSLDSFPEQKHNPLTDHADFANVMPDSLMKLAVDCINTGRECDAGGPIAADPGAGTPSPTPTVSQTQVPSPVPPETSRTESPSKGAHAHSTAPRNQGGQQARQGPPAQPARTPGAGDDQQPAQPVQGSLSTTGGSGDRLPDASNAQPGSPQGNAATSQDAAPGQVDTAERQLAEPPLSDTSASRGLAGAPAEPPAAGAPAEPPAAGAPAGAPAKAPAGALAGAPAAAPARAPATNQAAAPTAGVNNTMLYVFNGVALAALAGWLTVLVRRRRPQ